jgi:cell shape-determining protein MreC
MQKIYLKILIGIIVLLWIIYFTQIYFVSSKESFTPKINSLFRPYVRNVNTEYESFVNNYGPNVIITKLKKWNIY